MKNYILFLLLTITFVSCSREEDGPSSQDPYEQTYGFTIQRDPSFATLPVGYTMPFTFNLVTNYDFSNPNIHTRFIYNSNIYNGGILKLNGVVLAPSTAYYFTSKNNVFEYTGNVSGNHKIKFMILNEHYSKDETFDFNFQ